jgi:hypothetical protein
MFLICLCVDGIIDINALTGNEPHFIGQQENHSVNIMMVCNPKFVFYDINTNWLDLIKDACVLKNRRTCLMRDRWQGYYSWG